MVDFLLDNTLGAWHAGKVLATKSALADTAQGEEDFRKAVALPGCPWNYLRFVKDADGKWTPAAGTFDGWPKAAKELRCLDPCMGSGHFVVATFERLVALRLADEELEEESAVQAVIRDNLFGLEIDPRCTQIAAFNLALAAWRRVGHCTLPAMNLACSGLSPNAKQEDWLKLAGGNERLRNGMELLYGLFKDAPVLGSLINPPATESDLLVASFHELQPLLRTAIAQEAKDDTTHEMVVTARGLASAAEILTGQFTLVATNVPYLGRGKQCEVLQDYCERVYVEAQADLAICFVERCLEFCAQGVGSIAVVTPQNWLFLSTYRAFRLKFLRAHALQFAARLGPNAFQDMNWWAATTALVVASAGRPSHEHVSYGADVSSHKAQEAKASLLRGEAVDGHFDTVTSTLQNQLSCDRDALIVFRTGSQAPPLNTYASSNTGLQTGDNDHYSFLFWELSKLDVGWEFFHRTSKVTCSYGGRLRILRWEDGTGDLANEPGFRSNLGLDCRGKRGVLVHRMNQLHATLYSGEIFDQNGATIIPNDPHLLEPIWCFVSSPEYHKEVRLLDSKTGVTPAILGKVPFDLEHWQKIAEEKYPHGLPKPFCSDPTQWLFSGCPTDSDQPLHVAVARLLGYQWPRQVGANFQDCPALGPDGLEELADDDGIVCLSATKGEAPAAERLWDVLLRALGKFDLRALIANAGPKGSKSETLEDWLRNEFFEQHCTLFEHHPFVWHIWDGHDSGFSALVNYHKLTYENLEALTYVYLGDWIRRQQAVADAGEAGSDTRVLAAKRLQAQLKLILLGEPPHDIFVRWRPLSKQSIGWRPDLNDGVRLNIRPFLAKDIAGGKKGAGVLRSKPNIKWDKDKGSESVRDKDEFPWFWGWDEEKQDFAGVGDEPDLNRWNDCHYTNEFKRKAREG